MQDSPIGLHVREVALDATVWRRVPFWNMIWDKNMGRARATSSAFEDDPDGDPMSVHIADFVLEEGYDVGAILVGHDDFGVVALSVRFLVEELSMQVVHTPKRGQPAHASVIGPKTGSKKKKMYQRAAWVVPPTPEQEAALRQKAGVD